MSYYATYSYNEVDRDNYPYVETETEKFNTIDELKQAMAKKVYEWGRDDHGRLKIYDIVISQVIEDFDVENSPEFYEVEGQALANQLDRKFRDC